MVPEMGWLRHVAHFKFWASHPYLRSGLTYSCQIWYTGGLYQVSQKNKKSPPKGAWLWSRDLFNFLVSLQYLRNGYS